MLIHLPSVASYIDTTDALIYAAYQNGEIDPDSAMSVADCSPRWTECLSKEDRETIDVIERYLNLRLQNLLLRK